ncbi:MAG: hypothetical protein PHT84_03650 [Candidatus Pacebacteria bacterium]|nr:hypothetical protein [Candidatus Paceibacterota bacterium]
MAQVEGIVALLPGGKKAVAVEVQAPTLTTGAAAITVSEVNKIDYVIGTLRNPNLDAGVALALVYGVATTPNQIDVTIKKSDGSTWSDALTADVDETVISFLVVGA